MSEQIFNNAAVREVEDKIVALMTRFGNLLGGKSLSNWAEGRYLQRRYIETTEHANRMSTALQEAEKALAECVARNNPCSGCGQLNVTEGQSGHRSLLCGANHTYYECSHASEVYNHTTTTSCPPTGEHQMLICETRGHEHRCSGCNNLYSPWDSTLVDVHRSRTCYYCNQSYRECDTNQYCSHGPLLSHDGN